MLADKGEGVQKCQKPVDIICEETLIDIITLGNVANIMIRCD